MKIIDEHTVLDSLSPREAVLTIRERLQTFDPAEDAQRESISLQGRGTMLTMPSSTEQMSGIKILTVNPHSEELETPRIQGQYLLFDGETLTPRASLDGAAITTLRTPATSVAGILDFIASSSEPLEVVIFGTGPQGRAHENTLRSTLENVREVKVTYISRTRPEGLENWAQSGSEKAQKAISEAELVICATSASDPILLKDDVRRDVVIVALGSHTPQAREVDGALMGSAQVILEDRETAQRECGDVIQAVAEGHLDYTDTVTMRDVVLGKAELTRNQPIVFKFSGMGWEDLAVASAVYQKVA